VTSLTQEAARRRADLVTVESYELELDLDAGEHHFGSRTTIRFHSASRGEPTFVDVAASELRSVTLNGAQLDPASCYDAAGRRITIDGLQAENELVVDAVMTYSHDGEGLHRHTDPADGRTYLYAMSFLDAAPRWFACFDQPDLKAPVRAAVRCPTDWSVRGNGPATELEPGRWSIAATGPLATYFITLVAGPYHVVSDAHDGIPLSLLVRQSLAEYLDRQAESLFAHTKHCLDEFHALFDVRYPWGEYNQAFVPEFNAGAMENPGCVTFRDSMIFRSRATESELLDRRVTIAHEMAHMWFGDLVTMRWWDDLWLNESFAEYLGCRVTGSAAWVGFGALRKSWGYAADRRPSTHPVAGNGAEDAATALSDFDGISYAKGASVLRQLAAYLGDDVFLGGLRNYIATFARRNAQFADLLASWARAGAVDLDTWADSWLLTTGLDELAVDDGVLVRRNVDGVERSHAIEVTALAADGTAVATTRARVTSAVTPAGMSGDLVVPDSLDESWAKVVLAETAWEAMPQALPGIGEPRTRVAIWNALQLAVADAEVDPAIAVDVVVGALPAETDDSVIRAVGRWAAGSLTGCYLSDTRRARAAARTSRAMLRTAARAEPGSSRQLAAVRVAIATTSDIARLQGWLDGVHLPPGLAVDAELRWSIVLRLAQLGELDVAAIDDEAARDRSSQGAVHAARCHAARPDPAAKAEAWETLMHDADRPNYELYALAEGFWHPDQRSITAAFVPRYFADIPQTARLRSGWVVARIASLAYPWTAVEPATLHSTEQLLADNDLDRQLRRAVIDAADDLRRALQACQAFDVAPHVRR
jgi:aminopeptidase N